MVEFRSLSEDRWKRMDGVLHVREQLANIVDNSRASILGPGSISIKEHTLKLNRHPWHALGSSP